MSDKSWKKIFKDHKIDTHNFDESPFFINSADIKISTQGFKKTGEKEVRILCKQDSREDRPKVFKEKGLFLLPVKNGHYVILKGEGYVDIPDISDEVLIYSSKLDFTLESSKVGNSEMQYLDYAYASSLIRTFMEDDSLVLTIRGRKYTPKFDFKVNEQEVSVKSVQTEVDAGYEGKKQIVLIEAKNSKTKNLIIRQLYYPYRKWLDDTTKDVVTLFFEKQGSNFLLWQFEFDDKNDYNSIKLVKSKKYKIEE